jgi:hypothetical protein
MKSIYNRFSFMTVIGFYFAIANLILLGLVWWLSDSTSVFLEILYLAKTPVFRIFVGEMLLFAFIFILLSLNTVDHSSPFSKVTLETKGEIDTEDITKLAMLFGFMFFTVVVTALSGYFFESVDWKVALLETILWVLPLTLATMFAFFLSIPLGSAIFFIAGLIVENLRD